MSNANSKKFVDSVNYHCFDVLKRRRTQSEEQRLAQISNQLSNYTNRQRHQSTIEMRNVLVTVFGSFFPRWGRLVKAVFDFRDKHFGYVVGCAKTTETKRAAEKRLIMSRGKKTSTGAEPEHEPLSRLLFLLHGEGWSKNKRGPVISWCDDKNWTSTLMQVGNFVMPKRKSLRNDPLAYMRRDAPEMVRYCAYDKLISTT